MMVTRLEVRRGRLVILLSGLLFAGCASTKVSDRQTDITGQGYLFSAVVIFLGNALVLLIGIPLLTARVDLMKMFGWWLQNTSELVHRIGAMF